MPVLFCSLAILDPRVGHTMDVLHLSLSSDILTDSSTESPVHVLMLSIQAVRGLPRQRAPGIVFCIISFHSIIVINDIQIVRCFCQFTLLHEQRHHQIDKWIVSNTSA